MTVEELYKAVGNMDERHLKDLIESETKVCSHSVKSSFSGERTIVMDVVKQKKVSLRVLAIAAALLVAAGVAAAVLFGTKKDKKEYKEKIIENYFREKIIDLPESVASVNGMYGDAERLFIPAYMVYNEESEPYAEIYSTDGIKKGQTDIRQYGDKYGKVYLCEKNVYILLWNDSYRKLLRADKESGEIRDVTELTDDLWIEDIKETLNGNTEITEYIIDDGEITDYYVSICDDSMNEISRTVFSDSKLLEQGMMFSGYIHYEDGGYFTFYRHRDDENTVDMYRYSAEGILSYCKKDIASDMNGYFQGVFLSTENRPAVYTASFEKNTSDIMFSFNEYDPDTGEVTERFDSNLEGSTHGYFSVINASGEMYEKYDLIYSVEGKIYGYEMRKDEVTELFRDKRNEESRFEYASLYENDIAVSGIECSGDTIRGERLLITDIHGNINNIVDLGDENSSIKDLCTTENGDIFALCKLYDAEIRTSRYYILRMDPTGNVISRYEYEESGERFICGEDGKIAISENKYSTMDYSADHSIVFLDPDGKIIGQKNTTAIDTVKYFRTGKDRYAWYPTAEGSISVKKINFENLSLSDVCSIDYNVSEIYSGYGDYDAVLKMNDGLYGFCFSSGEPTEIINWSDSDLDIPEYISILNNDMIAANMDHISIGTEEKLDLSLHFIKRVSDEELKKVQQKKVITVAGDNVNEGFAKAVRKFNAENENCRIHIEDYSKYDDSFGRTLINGYGMMKLNEDIISGKTPDIIIFNNTFSREKFAYDGVFEDLNSYLENDNDLSRSDFFENILDVYSVNNRQYFIPLNFSINTMVGKRLVIGNEGELSYDKMFEMSEKIDLFGYQTYDDLKNYLLRVSEFTDYSSYTCSFDSEKFINLISIIKKFGMTPKERNNLLDHDEYEKMISGLANGLFALEIQPIRDFDSYNSMSQSYAPIDPSFTGFPSDTGSSFTADSCKILSLFHSSPNKDEAWEFIKTLLSEESQKSISRSSSIMGFPVRKSAFEALAHEKIERAKYGSYSGQDCFGNFIEYKKINNDTIDKLTEIILSVTSALSQDLTVQKIIDDQLELYFADGQTAEETARNIQNGVSLYLKEIK